MNIKETSRHATCNSFDHQPHDGESSNASRPSQVGDENVVGIYIGGHMSCRKDDIVKVGGCFLTRKGLDWNPSPERRKLSIISIAVWVMIGVVVLLTLVGGCAWAMVTECSYYTVASTIREGTGSGIGLTSSGEILKDEGEYTCAHATAPYGTRLHITNKLNGRKIVARVNDRGPSAYLRKLGRSLDINLSAAKALGIDKTGVAIVDVKIVGGSDE